MSVSIPLSVTEPAQALDASKRLPELDGLRGIAILLVVFWHYFASRYSIPDGSPIVEQLVVATRLSWSGVDLFFVLSGFLLAGILIDHRSSSTYFRSFYGRRICRIFPLYYALLIVFVIGVVLNDHGVVSRPAWLFRGNAPLWTYFTFTQNVWMADTGSWGARFNSVTWSLAIEEQFYLLLPLIVRFVPVRALGWAFAALIAASVAFRFWAFAIPHGGLACYFLPFARMDALGLGALGAWLLRKPRLWSALVVARWAQATVLALLFAGVVGMTWADYKIRSWEMSSFGYTWLALFYFSIIVFVLTQPDTALARVARWSPLRRLGLISFGVYLLHQIVDRLAFTYLLDQPGVLKRSSDLLVPFGTFGVTLLLAAASWRFFEKPILQWGERFRFRAGS